MKKSTPTTLIPVSSLAGGEAGGGVRVETSAAAPVPGCCRSGAAATSPQDIATCPFGVKVKLIDGSGKSALGIRSPYQPNWQDENRNLPLSFTPVSWESLSLPVQS